MLTLVKKNPYFRVNPRLGLVDAEEGRRQRAFGEGKQIQLEADQEVFDELKDWYDRLLEDYKRLKKERVAK